MERLLYMIIYNVLIVIALVQCSVYNPSGAPYTGDTHHANITFNYLD